MKKYQVGDQIKVEVEGQIMGIEIDASKKQLIAKVLSKDRNYCWIKIDDLPTLK